MACRYLVLSGLRHNFKGNIVAVRRYLSRDTNCNPAVLIATCYSPPICQEPILKT